MKLARQITLAGAHETTCYVVPCAGVHGSCAEAYKATPHVRILQFSSLFQVFFSLGTSNESSSFFIVFNCLLRTFELQSLYP